MNKFWLTFSNPSLEGSYQSFNQPFMHKQFYDYFKLQSAMIITMAFLGSIIEEICIRRIISMTGFSCFLLLSFFLKRHFNNKFFKTILIIFCSSIGFMFMEIAHMGSDQNMIEKVACFHFLCFQFYIDLILLTRIGWVYCGGIYLVNMIFYFYRFSLYNAPSNYIVLAGGTFLIINFTTIAYRHEKNGREYFRKLQESNQNLKKFEEVMNGILPSPIIILNYEEKNVDFMNSSAQKMLSRQKSKEIGRNSEFSKKLLKRVGKDENIQTLQSIEEIFDNRYAVIKHDLKVCLGEKLLFSSLMRKFYEEICDLTQFLTIHISDIDFKASQNEESFQFLGEKSYFEVKLCKIQWGKKTCLLLIFNDQSKAKRLMELINLDRYKNEMLASISHDLRTPLHGVVGMMNSVQPFIKEREAQKNLKIGMRCANLLNFLICDILDFSQMAFKKLKLNFENVNLAEMTNEILQLVKIQAKKKLLTLKTELNFSDDPFIYSDPTRIKQILLNLLNNAIKFTNEGCITLKIDVLRDDKLKFSVIDTGIGIRSDEIKKLFALFGKFNQNPQDGQKTGICFGLTISQNLAKMLYSGQDGGIQVESEYGKGSIFSFIIERKKVDYDEISISNEKKMDESSSIDLTKYTSSKSMEKSLLCPNFMSTLSDLPNHQTILIVDDDPINVMILEQYLKFFKFDFHSTMNGLEAVKFIEKEVIEGNKEIAAILMDCNMPIMDGFKASETINEILRKNKRKDIPIIAITANVTNEDMELCFKSGMKRYLAKPVRRNDLGNELQNLLKIKINID